MKEATDKQYHTGFKIYYAGTKIGCLVFRNYLPWFIISAASDDFNLQSDCFVCAILTHGKEGVVYGIDDKVEVKILLEPFKGNNCKGLVGKPKIFFIQVRLPGTVIILNFWTDRWETV